MSARDFYHNTVKNALAKAGWTITNDPLTLQFFEVNMYVDLGAEIMIAADKDQQQIAVEVKSFLQEPFLPEFYGALGQFLSYRVALKKKYPQRILYLAIPDDAYKTHFTLKFVKAIIKAYRLKYLVYDVKKEEIIKWIN